MTDESEQRSDSYYLGRAIQYKTKKYSHASTAMEENPELTMEYLRRMIDAKKYIFGTENFERSVKREH